MWGEVTPAERLRSITRRSVPEHLLASEAADALAGFAREPASLVVACRRLLAHHRAHGQLWWVCAQILGAADATRAAHEAAGLLDRDRTASRLAASLPLLDDAVVLSVGWPHVVDEAMAERADLPVAALRVDGADPAARLRGRMTDRPVRIVDPWDPALERVGLLLVPAAAIGPREALVAAGVGEAIDVLGAAVGEVWLVGGVGRVLPARLFDAVVAATAEPVAELPAGDDDDAVERLSLERVDRVVGARGVERPVDATARPDCPVVPELLRPLT